MATGRDILKKLQSLTDEELNLECFHIHAEYASSYDSVGCEVEQEIDDVSVSQTYDRNGNKADKILKFGY